MKTTNFRNNLIKIETVVKKYVDLLNLKSNFVEKEN